MTDRIQACPQCQAPLDLSSLPEHLTRFHLWRQSTTLWTCSQCPYLGCSLTDAITHANLEGHSLEKPQDSESDCLAYAVLITRGEQGPQTSGQSQIRLEDQLTRKSEPAEDTSGGEQSLETSLQSLATHSANPETDYPAGIELHCTKCGYVLRSLYASRAVAHVSKCYSIRPYACSSCGLQSSKKDNVQRHIRTTCTDANVVTVEKESNEAAIREGLRQSFPTLDSHWTGL